MSNEKQQTAVEWLIDKLNNVKPTEFCSIETIKKWCEQAKEMEKEQIEEAFANGVDDEYEYHINNQQRTNSEDYYNETYGGNE
jgi:hypothetical protein